MLYIHTYIHSKGFVTGTLYCRQWCIAKNGGGYTQRGMAKGLKVPCLFMITEVSIRCQKNPEVGIRRIPAYTPQYTTDCRSGHLCSFYIVFAALGALFTVNITVCCKQLFSIHSVSVSCVVHCVSTDTASVQLLPCESIISRTPGMLTANVGPTTVRQSAVLTKTGFPRVLQSTEKS